MAAYTLMALMLTTGGLVSAADVTAKGGNSQQCELHWVMSACKHYRLLASPNFHAFIPPEKLDDTCRELEAALDCVYPLLDGCGDRASIPFDMQRSVVSVVCGKQKEEYLSGARCLQTVAEMVHHSCMPLLTNMTHLSSGPCGLMDEASRCAVSAVRMHDVCTETDAELMVDLMDAYLQPSVGLLCTQWKQERRTSVPATPVSAPTPLGKHGKTRRPSETARAVDSSRDRENPVLGDNARSQTTQTSTKRPHQTRQAGSTEVNAGTTVTPSGDSQTDRPQNSARRSLTTMLGNMILLFSSMFILKSFI